MTTVQIVRGAEGPKYDPYSFTETTVRRLGRVFVAHEGLVEFYKIDECDVTLEGWIKAAGAIPQKFEDWLMKNKYRQMERHLKTCPGRFNCQDVRGYPGETLTVCGCGKVLDYSFDISAVI